MGNKPRAPAPICNAPAGAQEAACFVPVVKEAPVSENIVTMALILVAPVYQDGNKWRFGKGDVLQVELAIKQTRTASRISVDRQVLLVLEYQQASQHTVGYKPFSRVGRRKLPSHGSRHGRSGRAVRWPRGPCCRAGAGAAHT